jgi:hypothetical protein
VESVSQGGEIAGKKTGKDWNLGDKEGVERECGHSYGLAPVAGQS